MVDGTTTEMTYDDRGNMLTKTEAIETPLERITTYEYHSDFNKVETETVQSVDSPGNYRTITYTYEEGDIGKGNLLFRTISGYSNGSPVSSTTAYTYNDNGQLKTINGPRTDVNDIITIDKDQDKGYINYITYPNGIGTVYYSNYDANHNVRTITDLNGITTHYTYDYAGRIKTVTTGSAVTEYEYDYNGHIKQVIMPEENTISYEYYDTYKIKRITDDLGNYIEYEYDDMGMKTREEYHDTAGTLTKYLDFEYDIINQLESINNPDNSYTSFTYDNMGKPETIKDPLYNANATNGSVTEYEYDDMGRLITVIQNDKGAEPEAITEYRYDLHDNLIKVIDAEDKVTSYTYDDLGNLIKTVSPDTGITEYGYDAAGNLDSKTDAVGTTDPKTTIYGYDALNRLELIDFDIDTDIEYQYDQTDVANGKGRLTTMIDASGTTRYEYDMRGNIVKQHCTIDNITYTTEFEYDKNDQLTKTVYPYDSGSSSAGLSIIYDRNFNGNITGVKSSYGQFAWSLTSDMKYEPFGGLKSKLLHFPDIRVEIDWDEQYRIKNITSEILNPSGIVLDWNYTHDFNGNISSLTINDSMIIPEMANTRSDDYAYKTDTDLIDYIEPDDGIALIYSYDNNGNITSDGSRTFTYNENNRLKSVDKSGVVTDFVYNGKGQRVKKVSGGNITLYHYDLSGNLIAESDNASGVMDVQYFYAGSERICMSDQNGSYFYHNDHLGRPIAMTNGNGVIVWRAHYNTFGKATVEPGSTVVNNFRFPGQYYDEETGLHYNYFRYYDPDTGRYITADPIGLAGGINLYAYTGNNPVNWIDPLGLFSYLVADHYRTAVDAARNLHNNRNQYNKKVDDKTVKESWDRKVPAYYHQHGTGNEEHIKFVSPVDPDGESSEAIFTKDFIPVEDPVNGPTYNFADPRNDPWGHFGKDMLPYYIWGNSPEDTTFMVQRIIGPGAERILERFLDLYDERTSPCK